MDGNCLFRCVAHQLFGDPGLHKEIRANCVEFMRKNADQFRSFVDSDFSEYLLKMAVDSTWGDEIELNALSKLYKMRVEVYRNRSLIPFPVFGSSDDEIVRFFYVNNKHYDSIVPADK
jgi:hypothetical protein